MIFSFWVKEKDWRGGYNPSVYYANQPVVPSHTDFHPKQKLTAGITQYTSPVRSLLNQMYYLIGS